MRMKEIDQLKKLLKNRDTSLIQIAKDIGIRRMTLWRWMNGNVSPSLMGMDRLREYLNKNMTK
jgi:transcriptional regulator with XRE-family HTH domain